jgi:hypothetical protein
MVGPVEQSLAMTVSCRDFPACAFAKKASCSKSLVDFSRRIFVDLKSRAIDEHCSRNIVPASSVRASLFRHWIYSQPLLVPKIFAVAIQKSIKRT